jgi:hypothetical protein
LNASINRPLFITFASYCGPNPPCKFTLHRGMQGGSNM